jgi:aminopeptidase C
MNDNNHYLGDAIAAIAVVIAIVCFVAAIASGIRHNGNVKAGDATFYVLINEDLREKVIEHMNNGEAVYVDANMEINVVGTLSPQKQFMWKQQSDQTPGE